MDPAQAGELTRLGQELGPDVPPDEAVAAVREVRRAGVPPFADGAVAELRHGPDGEVIADIRIPGPAVDGAAK